MPLFKLRDGAELHYEVHGSGPVLFLVAGLGGDGRWWGDNVSELARQFTVVVHDHRGTARSSLSRIDYSVSQMADDALQLIEGLGYDKVHWCGHSTGGAMGQVLAIEHPERIGRLVLSATWAKTDAFFRRLFEVRSLVLRELGPAAYLKSSALALNSPAWVRDHDADLIAAEARASDTIPVPEIVLSRIAAIVAHDRARAVAEGEGAYPGPLRPRRHGDAALLHRGTGTPDPGGARLCAAGRRPCISERARPGVSSCNDHLPAGVVTAMKIEPLIAAAAAELTAIRAISTPIRSWASRKSVPAPSWPRS